MTLKGKMFRRVSYVCVCLIKVTYIIIIKQIPKYPKVILPQFQVFSDPDHSRRLKES